MELSFSSQDILETQIPFFRHDESPTKGALLREWNCIDGNDSHVILNSVMLQQVLMDFDHGMICQMEAINFLP